MTGWVRGVSGAACAGLILCTALLSGPASAQDRKGDHSQPPAELASYFEQVRKAEAIEDREQRCLAYPDLPGNQWPEAAAAGRCVRTMQEVGFSLDELHGLLAEAEGAARLEARMQALLEAHYTDPRQRDRIFSVFNHFDEGDQAGAVAAAWLRKAPRSPFAMTAMGTHRAEQGWSARGGAYVANTSAPQLQRMRQEFAGAVPLLVEALELEPRLTPACGTLAGIGRMSSDSLQQHSLAHCLQVDPLSYALVWEWMKSAMPKWGGSPNDMAVVAAYVRKHGVQNPALCSLLAEPPGYEASVAKKFNEGREAFVAASRAGPGAAMMRDAGRASWTVDDGPWTAIMYFSQALRFWPDELKIRGWRGMALTDAGHYKWALEDLLPAVAAAPEDLHLQLATGTSLMMLDRLTMARPHLKRALKLEGRENDALARYCSTFMDVPGGAGEREARDCTAKLVTLAPTVGAFWGWRYQALMAAQDETWPDAAAKFIRHADRSDPAQMFLRKNLLDSGVEP